jgi:trk system potassium uptake protein
MGLTVTALKPKGGPGSLPRGDTILHEGDVLVVGGSKKAIDRSPLVEPDGR